MLTKITAYSRWIGVDPLVLNVINRPETDLFEVRNVDGLGPVTADVNTTPSGSLDGEFFAGSSVGKRNLVFTLGLTPDWLDWTVSRLRRVLEKYFMPKQRAHLVFETMEFPPVEIFGYVESNESNMFSKDPEQQISIICPSPDFIGVDPVVINGQTDFDPLVIDYQGSIETGVIVGVRRISDPAPTKITIFTQSFINKNFVTDVSVDAANMFEVSSIFGDKYVQNVEIATSIATSRLHDVEEGYAWPTLAPGSNVFVVSSDAGIQSWELAYLEHYGSL